MKAFTLIELMVVMAITAIVLSGGVAAYRGFEEKYRIKQAGAEFQTNMRLFQKKAISGEKPVECLGSFEGVRVRNIGNNNYAFQSQCSSVDAPEQTVPLTGGLEFNPSNFNLFFATLNSAVIGAPKTIGITKAGSAHTYEVAVEVNGVIKGGLNQ